MIASEWIFYLRDTPMVDHRQPSKMDSGESLYAASKGRPLVCIAAGRVPEDSDSGGITIHFCVATCCPSDVSGGNEGPGFSKAFGRMIAQARLRQQKTVAHRRNRWAWEEPKEFTTDVGLTIPIYTVDPTLPQVQRAILYCITDSTYRFAPTARKLAEEWLARDSAV